MITTRRTAALALGLAATISAEAAAQECLGISAGSRGYVSYGVEGTDGVTGQAATVGLRLSDFNVQLHGRLMDPGGTSFSGGVTGSVKTIEAQVAYPITKKVPLCVFAGLGWTNYKLERTGFFGGTEPTTETGPFTQLQVPIGISLGKEFRVTERFRVSGFVQNAALYRFERYDSGLASGGYRTHNTLGLGVTVGAGLSYGPLMLRSTISNHKTLNNSVGLYDDFPYMSLQLGVKF
jgi:hypothetical protein